MIAETLGRVFGVMKVLTSKFEVFVLDDCAPKPLLEAGRQKLFQAQLRRNLNAASAVA
jgi:hypothetical protein